MRSGVVAAGLIAACVNSAIWAYCVLDIQHRLGNMTGSGGSYVAMDRIIANAAVVLGVLGGIAALFGWFLKPREETDRAAAARRRWANWVILAGLVLLALAGFLFVLPIPFGLFGNDLVPFVFLLPAAGIVVLVVGGMLAVTAGEHASGATG